MSEFSDALKLVKKHLKEDSELYHTYKANIAMAFKDQYDHNEKKYKNRQDIHMIANVAASNFLNLLIKD
jgi:hypothetical protein